MAITQKDIAQLKFIFSTKDDFEELSEKFGELAKKIDLLPTKDDFFTKMDEVVGELETMRQEGTVGSHQISDHEDRIEKLEEIHPVGKHALAT